MIDRIISKLSSNKTVPKIFRNSWFRNVFLGLLLGAFGVQLYFAWGSAQEIGEVFVRMIIITTFITIILGSVYQQRTWCMICPMGTLAHYVAGSKARKDKIKQVTFHKNSCVNCKQCSKSCPINIDVMDYKSIGKVDDANCLKCNVCVEKCPKKALHIA